MAKLAQNSVYDSHYKICHSGPGGLAIDVCPLGNAVLLPSLSIIAPGESTPVGRMDEAGIARFLLNADQVERLRAAPGLDRSPYLGLLCDAFMSVKAADRLWGYGIRINRGDQTLPICDAYGEAMAMDDLGFVHCLLQRFPADKGVARGHDILCLA